MRKLEKKIAEDSKKYHDKDWIWFWDRMVKTINEHNKKESKFRQLSQGKHCLNNDKNNSTILAKLIAERFFEFGRLQMICSVNYKDIMREIDLK